MNREKRPLPKNCKKIMVFIRRAASIWNKYTKIRLPESLAACAAILSVIVTIIYVSLTAWLNIKQEGQFQLVNRPKITVSSTFPKGDVRSGVIIFTNSGNLDAKDLVFIWRIIHIKDINNIISFPKTEKEAIRKYAGLCPEEEYPLSYESPLNLKDQFVFLIICCGYKGAGIKGHMPKDFVFLWLVNDKVQLWSIPGALSAEHSRIIEDVKSHLKKAIK